MLLRKLINLLDATLIDSHQGSNGRAFKGRAPISTFTKEKKTKLILIFFLIEHKNIKQRIRSK